MIYNARWYDQIRLFDLRNEKKQNSSLIKHRFVIDLPDCACVRCIRSVEPGKALRRNTITNELFKTTTVFTATLPGKINVFDVYIPGGMEGVEIFIQDYISLINGLMHLWK